MPTRSITCFTCDAFLTFDPKHTLWTCSACDLHHHTEDIEIADIPQYTDEALQAALYYCEHGWIALRQHLTQNRWRSTPLPLPQKEDYIPTYVALLMFHLLLSFVFARLGLGNYVAWGIFQGIFAFIWVQVLRSYMRSKKYYEKRDLFLRKRRYLLNEMRYRNLRPDPRIPFPSMR